MSSPDNLIEEYKHLSNEKKEMVYHIALKYLRYDTESANDVAQEVMLMWYQYIVEGRDIKQLDSWLALVTKHKSLRHLERLELQKELCEKIEMTLSEQPSAEEQAIKSIDISHSRSILDELYRKNPRWYEIMLMAYVMGYRHREIAEHFGVSENAINKVLSRATAWCKNNYDLSER